MATPPTGPHTARYRPGVHGDHEDGRLHSPVFLRNSPPLIATLATLFADRDGPVLEIGAGTGQHAAAFQLAFPHLDWWPSDPDPIHRASVAAWAAHLHLPIRAELAIDASTGWAEEISFLGPLTAVISLNVIHIAPIAVAKGIIRGAAQTLAADGLLLFYGPFMEDGAHTSAGNASFDDGLRAENPDWGLRDIADITELAAGHGLILHQTMAMPANNRIVAFRKP